MGITRDSYKKLYKNFRSRLSKYRRNLRYNYKKNLKKKQSVSILPQIELELRMSAEDDLYQIVSEIAHVRKYIRNMCFEYCGEAAEEMNNYFEVICDLYHRAITHYNRSIKNESMLTIIDVEKYRKEYDEFMDECGINYNLVYEFLFDFPEDSGYSTPPRPTEKIKNKLNDMKDDIEILTRKISRL